jgi:hypothetical protein
MMPVVVAMIFACACHGTNPAAPDSSANPGDDGSIDAPFDTPVGTWTWLDVPGMTCGNGAPTGIGVNRSTDSNDVVVFFEGGGACWDAASCFTVKSAIHIEDGYNAQTLAAELHYFPFDRTDPTHPFATPTYIFVPYCTGDLHAGVRTATYDVVGTPRMVHHVGGTNAQLVVDRVHGALPDAAHVWVVGQSAGGYGATLNLHRFRAAWPTAELAVLQDSSMFISVAANYGLWKAEWDLQFPPDCTNCTTSFPAVIDAVVAAEPNTRLGLLTYDNDTTIKVFFGYGLFDSIVAQVNTLVTVHYAAPTTHVFELVGVDHTMLGGLATITGVGGVPLATWVRQWASGDPAWMTVR